MAVAEKIREAPDVLSQPEIELIIDQEEETTCVVIKPGRGVRKFLPNIISELFKLGRIVNISMPRFTKNQMQLFYAKPPDWKIKTGEEAIAICEKHGIDPIEHFGVREFTERCGLQKYVGESGLVGQIILQEWIADYMSSGQSVAIALRGENIVERARKWAKEFREKYCDDNLETAILQQRALHNLIHASETVKDAETEIWSIFTNTTPPNRQFE
jgi:nucleoside-diphosphate kinase